MARGVQVESPKTRLKEQYIFFGAFICGPLFALFAWGYAIYSFGFWGLLFGWIAAIPAYFMALYLGPLAVIVALVLLVCVLAIAAWSAMFT